MRRAKSLPTVSGEPDDQDKDYLYPTVSEPTPPSRLPIGDNTENVYFNSLISQEPQSPINKQPPAAGNSNQMLQGLNSPSVVITPGDQELTPY